MKDYFKLKTWAIILVMFLTAILLSSILVLFNFDKDFDISQINLARAGINDNVSGFAWSSNYGWISFNSTDCDIDGDGTYEGAGETGGPAPIGCPTSEAVNDYGVSIDGDGNFSGQAWSSNVGWIYFERSTTGNPPATPYKQTGAIARYDSVTGKVTGWAKILALGEEGWIKMDDNIWSDGVEINSGEFSGWAWNGNDVDEGYGMGWISFNSINCDADNNGLSDGTPIGCPVAGISISDYEVVYESPAPIAPTNLTAMEISCTYIKLAWTDNSNNETGFLVEVSSTGNFTGEEENFCNSGADIEECTETVSPSSTNYFRVRAIGNPDSDWEPASGGVVGTTSYCNPVLDPITVYNCEGVTLTWSQQGTGVDHYEVWRDSARIADNITPTQFSYIDSNIESGINYDYYIKAQIDGLDSNIESVTPCTNIPTWKEVKP